MPLRVNAQEYAEKWARRTSGAVQDYVAGVNRVSTAPGQEAANAQEAMRAGINEAIDSGRWAANVGSVSLSDWQDAARTKGQARLADGVNSAKDKVQDIAQINLANIERVVDRVRALPKATFQDRLNRMTTYATEMNQNKVRRR